MEVSKYTEEELIELTTATHSELMDVRKQIRRLKVVEQGLENRYDRYANMCVNQTKMEFDERESEITD
jgi:predicted nuclease with TOPRIM domain